MADDIFLFFFIITRKVRIVMGRWVSRKANSFLSLHPFEKKFTRKTKEEEEEEKMKPFLWARNQIVCALEHKENQRPLCARSPCFFLCSAHGTHRQDGGRVISGSSR